MDSFRRTQHAVRSTNKLALFLHFPFRNTHLAARSTRKIGFVSSGYGDAIFHIILFGKDIYADLTGHEIGFVSQNSFPQYAERSPRDSAVRRPTGTYGERNTNKLALFFQIALTAENAADAHKNFDIGYSFFIIRFIRIMRIWHP